jgi:hypothetical protein
VAAVSVEAASAVSAAVVLAAGALGGVGENGSDFFCLSEKKELSL